MELIFVFELIHFYIYFFVSIAIIFWPFHGFIDRAA